MGKKKEKSNFSKMLKENQKVIRVLTSDGEEKDLAAITNETVDSIVASPLDGMIPVSSSEAAENAVPGAMKLAISTAYAQSVFSMYEFALKYQSTKQTLVVVVPEKDAEDIWDSNYASYGPLKDRSNLKLVLDKFPEKAKRKIADWGSESEVPGMFVIRIPNLVVFHGDIKKNTTSKAKFFDLVIEIVRSGKSMSKLKKKKPEEFADMSKFVVDSTVRVLKEFGSSCAHIPLDKDFYAEPHEYASLWARALNDDKNNILTRVVFCTPDPDDLVSFNAQLTEDMLKLAGFEIV